MACCLKPLSEPREREIKFIGLFEDRGHQGSYSPYKPFNHNLYIGIIIFPHIDNPQSTGLSEPMLTNQSDGIHMRAISQEMLKIFLLGMSLKITNSTLQTHLPGANELKAKNFW